MKIVVIADTHGDLSALRRVLLIEPDADLYLHCGDVQSSPYEIAPFAAVKGNGDGGSEFPFRYETDTPFGKLHMEHYPIYGNAMYRSLQQDGVRIYLHGHTHVREEDTAEGIRIYCPGSLAFPEDNDKGTYLVLKIDGKTVDSKFKEIVI